MFVSSRVIVFSRILFVAASFVLVGCASDKSQVGVSDNSPGRVASTTDSQAQIALNAIGDGAYVIDVRAPEEFASGSLPQAVNIVHDQVESHMGALPKDHDQTIVVFCRSGRRAGVAKETLEGLGYTHVINGGGYADLLAAQ